MGASIYVVLRQPSPDLQPLAREVDGKMAAKAADQLAALAKSAGVPPLDSFASADPASMAEMLGMDPADFPPEQWFPATDGLRTVRALKASLPGAEVPRADAVAHDLAAFERVLAAAESAGVEFHFAIDI